MAILSPAFALFALTMLVVFRLGLRRYESGNRFGALT